MSIETTDVLDLAALSRAYDLLTLHRGEGADDPEHYDAATAFVVTSTGVLIEIALAAKAYRDMRKRFDFLVAGCSPYERGDEDESLRGAIADAGRALGEAERAIDAALARVRVGGGE